MSSKIFKMKAPENAYTMDTRVSEVRTPEGAWKLGELLSFVEMTHSKEWSGRYYVTVDPLTIPVALRTDFNKILDKVLEWPECVIWAGLNPATHDIVVNGFKL